ncbi:CehA/McbA family metallohydrolase [Aliikangiella coralliicola]|uniref:Uncharacterized protein n=1 Tax=Aliikangiella coralliicola TaxID=2592383 RepID=A0A545UD74_9GAMM|nr:CehA/McbA family metallohydrolase [Aliikangiella coralliicola]TQV87417.1 hypothetical protein FLL46_13315 [Aliikangiella coralliicola]
MAPTSWKSLLGRLNRLPFFLLFIAGLSHVELQAHDTIAGSRHHFDNHSNNTKDNTKDNNKTSKSDSSISGDSNLDNPRGIKTLNWTRESINRVLTAGYPESFGTFAFTRRQNPEYQSINGNNCVKANYLAFDIDDNFAFDIDEKIQLKLLVKSSNSNSLVYGYDRHGRADANATVSLDNTRENLNDNQLFWLSLDLDRARFINRGIGGTDFVLTTLETMLPLAELGPKTQTTFTLCDIKITRPQPNQTQTSRQTITFKFIDHNTDSKTPVRLGIYNSRGSSVLASESAVPIKYYEREVKHLNLKSYFAPYQYWPHANRYFVYSDGEYQVELSAGTYTIIATKGPEYKIAQKEITVSAGKPINQIVEIDMKRWINLPEKGWFSGDVHIHMQRGQKDHRSIFSILKAEDIHVSNLLEMTNTEQTHFRQFAMGEKGKIQIDNNAIVPGTEGPRTAHRGHILALNVANTLLASEQYFLYHKYLAFYQQQNALTGYAHVGSGEFNAAWGLALDAPFGLVDFVEIMQANRLRTKLWYELLNLGFRISPAAGSDFPYFDQPGAVRSYVKIENTTEKSKPFLSTQKWFDGLKRGRTLITNGPFIQLSVNNNEPGSILEITDQSPLKIEGKVSINSDFDSIDRLELIRCGKVIKTITPDTADNKTQLSLNYQLSTRDSGWIALRAYGKNYTFAHTGAVYLKNHSALSACKNQASATIATMMTRLDQMENSTVSLSKELEFWESEKIKNLYSQQLPLLKKRINMARDFYRHLQSQIKPPL